MNDENGANTVYDIPFDLTTMSPSSAVIVDLAPIAHASETDARTLHELDHFDQRDANLRRAGFFIRRLNGHRMRTLPGLIAEFDTAMQFPRWTMIWELQRWLDMMLDPALYIGGAGHGIVFAISKPQEFLIDDEQRWLNAFLEMVGDLRTAWGKFPTKKIYLTSEEAVPFHVVLDVTSEIDRESLLRRWRTAGAELQIIS